MIWTLLIFCKAKWTSEPRVHLKDAILRHPATRATRLPSLDLLLAEKDRDDDRKLQSEQKNIKVRTRPAEAEEFDEHREDRGERGRDARRGDIVSSDSSALTSFIKSKERVVLVFALISIPIPTTHLNLAVYKRIIHCTTDIHSIISLDWWHWWQYPRKRCFKLKFVGVWRAESPTNLNTLLFRHRPDTITCPPTVGQRGMLSGEDLVFCVQDQ